MKLRLRGKLKFISLTDWTMKVIFFCSIHACSDDCCNNLEMPNQPTNLLILCHTRQKDGNKMYSDHLILVGTRTFHGFILATRFFVSIAFQLIKRVY